MFDSLVFWLDYCNVFLAVCLLAFSFAGYVYIYIY